jgi:hypothetical protein
MTPTWKGVSGGGFRAAKTSAGRQSDIERAGVLP